MTHQDYFECKKRRNTPPSKIRSDIHLHLEETVEAMGAILIWVNQSNVTLTCGVTSWFAYWPESNNIFTDLWTMALSGYEPTTLKPFRVHKAIALAWFFISAGEPVYSEVGGALSLAMQLLVISKCARGCNLKQTLPSTPLRLKSNGDLQSDRTVSYSKESKLMVRLGCISALCLETEEPLHNEEVVAFRITPFKSEILINKITFAF